MSYAHAPAIEARNKLIALIWQAEDSGRYQNALNLRDIAGGRSKVPDEKRDEYAQHGPSVLG